MKTKITNAVVLITLNLAVLACSKFESNDMVFKSAVSSETLATPSPAAPADPAQDSSVVVDGPKAEEQKDGAPAAQDPVVVVTNSDEGRAPDAVVVVDEGAKTPDAVVVVDEGAKTPDAVVIVDEGAKTPDAVVIVDEGAKTPDAVVVVDEGAKTPDAVVVEEVIYAESEIPVCKIDLTVSGLGSAAKVVIASAPKSDLLGSVLKGFESLSNPELSAMRNAIESDKSGNGVQLLKDNDTFDKQLFKNNPLILVVINSSASKVIDMSGLGKDAQIFIMNVSKEHNTFCLRTNGNSSMGELSMSVLNSSSYASRGSVLINGNGSLNSYLKVAGGHRSGSNFEGKAMKDSKFTFITEGKNDTFTSVTGNGVSNSDFDIKIKGADKTGYGMSANFINDSRMRMEIQGEDDVKAIMAVEKMAGNEVSGWIKAKSGAKVDSSMSEDIEIMTLP